MYWVEMLTALTMLSEIRLRKATLTMLTVVRRTISPNMAGAKCRRPRSSGVNPREDRDANSKGTMLLLRVQLIEYHDKYMKLGEIPSYAYENFVEMYNAYHALGGNGMATKMYDEIKEMRLKNGGKE